MKGDAKTNPAETIVAVSAKELNISDGPKINFIYERWCKNKPAETIVAVSAKELNISDGPKINFIQYLKTNRRADMGYRKSRNDVNIKLLLSTTNLVKSDNTGIFFNRNNYSRRAHPNYKDYVK